MMLASKLVKNEFLKIGLCSPSLNCDTHMGIGRIFSMGRAKKSPGVVVGGKNIFLPKKQQKIYYFSQ
jgi:hypothetical protein